MPSTPNLDPDHKPPLTSFKLSQVHRQQLSDLCEWERADTGDPTVSWADIVRRLITAEHRKQKTARKPRKA